MKGATLHDLREDELALIDTMEIVSEGTDREEIEAKIQELGAAIRHKVDGTVRVRDYFESQIAMAKAEISRLEATIGRVGKMLNDLDFYVLSELETAEEHRLKGNLYTLCQGNVRRRSTSPTPRSSPRSSCGRSPRVPCLTRTPSSVRSRRRKTFPVRSCFSGCA